MSSLTYDTQMFVIYGGISLFCINYFGCMMKIIIFSSTQMYRNLPCTFYMLISAIGGALELIGALIQGILKTGFTTDITRMSAGWCVIRQYIVVTCPAIAVTCDWLATVDQFLVTSRSARLRRFSNIKSARLIVLGVIIFWILAGIPFFVYTNLSSTACSITNASVQRYSTYFYTYFYFSAVPLIVNFVFGILVYRNMKKRKNENQLLVQEADRQIVLMVLSQVVIIILSVLPYTLYEIYALATQNSIKTIPQLYQDGFASAVLNFFATLEFGSSFYAFVVVSSIFRQRVRQLFCCCIQSNAVQPLIR